MEATNDLSAKMMKVFMDSVKKSYFNLAKGFDMKLEFLSKDLSRSKKFITMQYMDEKSKAIKLLSSFDLANAIVIPLANLTKLESVNDAEGVFMDASVDEFGSLAKLIDDKKALPEKLRIIGATVSMSADYEGVKSKISRGLIGYSIVKTYANARDKNDDFLSYQQYLDCISKMGSEFKLNKVNGSWFQPGFLADQKNWSPDRLIVNAEF